MEQLFNLLFFPKGWLIDHDNNDKNRHDQFELLRSICIPKVIIHVIIIIILINLSYSII